MKTAAPAWASQRILPVDATRGALMLFSCLSHFAWWIHGTYPDLGSTLSGIGMVATPSFLLVSGAMVGLLCATPGREDRDLKSQLFNRGLFLVTVGHFLIALSEAHLNGGLLKTLPGISVVDEIGLCTMIAAFLVTRLADPVVCRRIAKTAVVTLLLAWCANLLWMPDTAGGVLAKDLLIGGSVASEHPSRHVAPTLQYMALYALGLPLGQLLASYTNSKSVRNRLPGRLAVAGGALVGLSCLLRLGRYEVDHVPFFLALPHAALDLTLKVSEKIPPSPVYVTFYCGSGLMLMAAAFQIAHREGSFGTDVLRWLAVIGRASLFVFVLQYFLFWTLPDLFGITANALCFALFFLNVVLMHSSAVLWARGRGNRHLTFGIKLYSRSA